jgi:hypothetical protein
MNRIRWLNAQWPSSIRTIGNTLKRMPFTEESIDGFAIERIRDDFVEGRFIEKLVYDEVLSDPFGNEDTVERITYRSTAFTLFAKFPYIELRNGQRSIKEFVNRLLQACDFDLVVSPITVNLLEWVDTFQSNIGTKIVVDSLQVSGVELERGITGKILLKGERDVRDAVKGIVGEKKYTLEKIQVKLSLAGKGLCLHLANNGTAKLPPDFEDELLPLLRQSFSKQVR